MALKSYEELIKVDVRQYCEERDGFTYLNWAKCIELLRQNGATEVYWEPIPDPQTGSSLRKTDIEFKDKNNNTNRCYETRIKVVIDDKEYEMQTPVMNGANPVKDNSMSQQRVWNSMCRAFVKCVAIHGLNFETWKQLHEEETYESEMGRRLVNRITGISKQKKIFNEGLKTTSNEDVKTLLKQSLGRTEIARLSGRKSYYSAKEKKIYLSKDAKSDTIAHELFHEIDDTYALVENGMLKNSVQQDYRRLQNQAKRYGKSIEEMLYLEYPEAFEVSKYGIKFKEEYRGISDILNGMSNGDILMGYSHKTDYWKKSGRLEKESWAQYGRMFYTDGKALEMAKKIFPEMSQEIEQRIRRLMK